MPLWFWTTVRLSNAARTTNLSHSAGRIISCIRALSSSNKKRRNRYAIQRCSSVPLAHLRLVNSRRGTRCALSCLRLAPFLTTDILRICGVFTDCVYTSHFCVASYVIPTKVALQPRGVYLKYKSLPQFSIPNSIKSRGANLRDGFYYTYKIVVFWLSLTICNRPKSYITTTSCGTSFLP